MERAFHPVHHVGTSSWHGLSRLVKCCNAFDNELLKSVKQGIAHMPAPVHRTRLPCTLEMIQHIVDQNTQPGASMQQVMLATGVYVAFFLWLRSSEYVSKTVVPLVDTHQFMSTDVQSVLNDPQFTLINSNQIGNYAYDHFCAFDIYMVQTFFETRCGSISILPCARSSILFIVFAYTSGGQVVRRSLWIKRRMVQYALNPNVRVNNRTRCQSVSS